MPLGPCGPVPRPRVVSGTKPSDPPEEDDVAPGFVVGHGLSRSRGRVAPWTLLGPIRPIPGPPVPQKLVPGDGVFPPEEDDVLADRVVDHDGELALLRTGPGGLLRPVRTVPGPRVVEGVADWACDSEEECPLMIPVVGHGSIQSYGRAVGRGLLGPVRSVPSPRVVAIRGRGVRRIALGGVQIGPTPEQDGGPGSSVEGHGGAVPCCRPVGRALLGPVRAVPGPGVAACPRGRTLPA